MKLNDVYSDGRDQTFQIKSLESKDGDPWVGYFNTRTLQEFSCRQEAFLVRFKSMPKS